MGGNYWVPGKLWRAIKYGLAILVTFFLKVFFVVFDFFGRGI